MGTLIVNADDWGRDVRTTDAILRCSRAGAISAVSAMVFMADSARAASLARAEGVDAGLHLNFTAPLTSSAVPAGLSERQQLLASRLRSHPLSRVVYYPALNPLFEYVVKAQLDEFQRLFGDQPARIDGHHHMHLCGNVVFGGLLPERTVVRRNFTFSRGEKWFVNRWYRQWIDGVIARRHRIVDYLFNLAPTEPASRLDRIVSLAAKSTVELETHPVNADEQSFLLGDGLRQRLCGASIARGFILRHAAEGRL